MTKEIDLKSLQQVELKILEQFINICHKEQLQYYVLGGTMLGAVRHKGFIPWDDDIDVALPRKDYEKFLDVAQKYLSKNYFLQTYITDNGIPWNYAKIRDSNTTFIQKSLSKCNINHGVYIDVFVLDYYPTHKIESIFFDIYNRLLTFRIRSTTYSSNKKYTILENIVRKIISSVLKIIYPNTVSVLKKRDKLFKSIKKSSLLANHCGFWGKKEIVPIDWYGKGIDMQFENLIVKVPEYYDKWLTQVYGNYMQLPPKEKQITHHRTDVIDLENSYTKYVKRTK